MKKVLKIIILLIWCGMSCNISFSQSSTTEIPKRFNNINDLNNFLSAQPQFKCAETSIVLTLSFSSGSYSAFVNDKVLGNFQVDLNSSHPYMALIGLPWMGGYGPAPMLLTLNGTDTSLSLLPVEGEENLSYNSGGYLQYGNTGRTSWMKLSLGLNGVSFTPVNNKPEPQKFYFIGFSSKSLEGNSHIYENEEGLVLAEFPGGQSALMKWISQNLRYPEEAAINNVQGVVRVKFVVEKDGTVSNPEIVKGVDKNLDEETLRLIRRMPKWFPAKNLGVNVRSYFSLKITFKTETR